MQNLKVKVNSNVCEITELFVQYGCKYFNHTCTTKDYAILRNGKVFFCKRKQALVLEDCQEVSIEQLHDMVVLKRNSIVDATHNTNSCDALGFLTSGNVEYFWNYTIKEWAKHGTANFKDYEMKPIQNNDLPFIDSEESLNDQIASAEEARQANKTVQDTLDERQKQYGCFEDVAHVTQGMIDLMRKCGYDRMPQTHQMSLYMICSKMARIVNGDFNHVDSWHDISGYAQLVEKLVKE